ncbi:MAG: transposase, partial [Firmicutes bacterium]|nr:transposase [Bacillota bacterium]
KKRILWSDGYFAASIGQVSQEIIERYIEEQG